MAQRFPVLILFLLLVPLILLSGIVPASAQPGVPTVRTWGGAENDIGQSVVVDALGNTYVTGSTVSFGPGSPMQSSLVLLKYDSAGSMAWQRIWAGSGNGSDAGQSVALDASGNIYVTGPSSSSFGSGSIGFVLLKLNASGVLLWQKTWGGGNVDSQGVAVDGSGYVYVVGSTSFGVGGNCGGAACSDVILMKFDSTGSPVWQRTWGGSRDDIAQGVALDASGNVYVAGYTDSFGGAYSHAFLLKFDATGGLQWQRTWGGSSFEYAHAVAASSSEIYVTGETASIGAGAQDVFLMKFNSSGSVTWQKTWGGGGLDIGNGVTLDVSGDVFVSGTTSSIGTGSYRVLLLKFDPAGNLLLQQSWGGNGFDLGYGIGVDSYGNAFLTGAVSEGLPYNFLPGSFAARNATFSPTTPTGIVGTPVSSAGTPKGTVSTPNGSQTYAGMQELFLLKYPVTLSVAFTTDPATGGTVDFNGTIYSNGENGFYGDGVATVAAVPSPAYMFKNWTTSGKVTVANASSNPTTASISGNGTLIAHFTHLRLSILNSVSMTPRSASLYVGRSAVFSASAVCSPGSCPTGVSFAWVLNNSLATLTYNSGSNVTLTTGPSAGIVNLTAMAFYNGFSVTTSATIMILSAPSPSLDTLAVAVILILVLMAAGCVLLFRMKKRPTTQIRSIFSGPSSSTVR